MNIFQGMWDTAYVLPADVFKDSAVKLSSETPGSKKLPFSQFLSFLRTIKMNKWEMAYILLPKHKWKCCLLQNVPRSSEVDVLATLD